MPGETGLVDIKRLVLSDTFNTWFDTTNQIIDAIDPITIYGIQSLTGVNLISGASGSNYNGIKYIGLLPDHGIGFYGTNNEIALNYSNLADGSGTPIVATGDYYAFYDVSDTTQNAAGTIKRVRASDILPATVNAPGGNINLEGNLTINGQLFVGGQNSFLASNDLRIEDKNIELAYQQAGFIGATGISSGSYPAVGATAYYYDPGIANYGITAATVIGIVKSVTGPNFGPTAEIKIGSAFIKGGPELFSLGGVIRFAGVGSSGGGPTGATFGIVGVFGDALSSFAVQGPTTEYFNDSQLNGAGFTIRGLSGDKTFTWSSSQTSLVSNVPLGVATENQYINARYFRNYGLTTDNKNDFVFLGSSANSQNTQIAVSYDNRGKWAFEYDDAVTGNETLLVRYATGPASTTYTVTTIRGLTTGPFGITSTAGGSANMWADGFNASFLDGAGGARVSTANSIPIADNRGRIYDQWLEASSTRTKVTQSAHGLSVGNVVAFSSAGGGYTAASAFVYTSPKAEAVGIVESVPDSNNFVIVTQGYISNIPNIAVMDSTYFVSSTVDGGMTTDEPTTVNSVRKPIFNPTVIAGGSAAGYVLSYPGQIVGAGATATDIVYMESLVPIGAIQQYAGSTDTPTYNQINWIPCDGRAVSYTPYVDLFNTIGNIYYARGIVSNTAGVNNPVITVERDTRGLASTDLVRLVVDTGSITGGTAWSASVVSVNTTNCTITLTGDSSAWPTTGIAQNSFVRIYGLVDVSSPSRAAASNFFIPDLRTRISVGSVTGGESSIWLGQTFITSGNVLEGIGTTFGIGATSGATGGGFLATNYLIRAIKNTSALILTGHNHDDRYILKTSSDTVSGDEYNFNSTGVPTLSINNSSGNVSIGVTATSVGTSWNPVGSNVDRALDVQGSTRAAIRVKTSSGGGEMFMSPRAGIQGDFGTSNNIPLVVHTNAVERMRIDTAGNVGIGTNNPQTLLDVSGAIPTLRIKNTSTSANAYSYLRLENDTGNQGLIWVNGNNNTSYGGAGAMSVWQNSNAPLLFGTNNKERMRIQSDGSVGIGTANAQDFLHIYADSPNIRLQDSADGGGFSRIVANSAGGQTGSLILQADVSGVNPSAYMRFDVGNGAGQRAMQIFANGKVGVGTSNPSSTLTVAGGLRVEYASAGITSGFFTNPQFNSTSATDITQNLTLSPAQFANYGTISSTYTIDPGAGINIISGNTLTIASGFTWKIM